MLSTMMIYIHYKGVRMGRKITDSVNDVESVANSWIGMIEKRYFSAAFGFLTL